MKSIAKTALYHIAGCSFTLLFAGGSVTFAHSGGMHNGGDHFNDRIHTFSGTAKSYRVRSIHRPTPLRYHAVTHPTKFRPVVGIPHSPIKPPKAGSPYACPDGAKPNLPCGTPITVSQPGYTSCTFENGYQLGCDIYPMPTGSAVGGPQPGGHGQHHAD